MPEDIQNNFDIKLNAQIARINGSPFSWFEDIYSDANGNSSNIPWAALSPNTNLISWIKNNNIISFKGKRALIVGCGLGDDAVALSEIGMEVFAFDISKTCIDWCQQRFPNSSVHWHVYNLLDLPESWTKYFDLVVEIHILQAVHTDIRDELAAALIPLLAKDGDLLCIGRTRLENDNLENKTGPPWPLKKTWLENWFSEFTLIGYNSIVDLNDGDSQRYRANFKNIIN